MSASISGKNIEFSFAQEFEREVRKLQKRYRSLNDDINALAAVLDERPVPESRKTFPILLQEPNRAYALKTYLHCDTIGNNRFIRVIYVYDASRHTIKFIEIYDKQSTNIHNQKRMENYFHQILGEVSQKADE